VNLPNAITLARIASTPLIAALPFSHSWQLRALGFALFIVAAVTDYYDGALARSRNLVTDLGKLLDPLADKALLAATLLPIYFLTGGLGFLHSLPPASYNMVWSAGVVGPVGPRGFAPSLHEWYPFVTPLGLVGLPLWILLVVLGRELFMTVFRQLAARRGVVIAAIGPAKWKTGFQSVWVGSAFFWFFAARAAAEHGWQSGLWRSFAYFNGLVGVATMIPAVLLTVYSLWLYLSRYHYVFTGGQPR
jgi:phosphatidylglycerophosphate synthase